MVALRVVGKEVLFGYLVITVALRRCTVIELCKGTPGVASTWPVITSCDIDVVVVFYRTLSGVMIVCFDGPLSYPTFGAQLG